jgi:hypothetical protein
LSARTIACLALVGAAAVLLVVTGCADIFGFEEGSPRPLGAGGTASATSSSATGGSAADGGAGNDATASSSSTAASSSAAAGGSGGCAGSSPVKRVFVTSSALAATFGGVPQGDAICAAHAAAACLCGTWKAWLSVLPTSAEQHLGSATGPWYLVDQSSLVASSTGDLTDGFLESPIEQDENGAAHAVLVWTGTTAYGGATDLDCIAWTTSAIQQSGSVGQSDHIDQAWSSQVGASPCDQVAHLYCFEL